MKTIENLSGSANPNGTFDEPRGALSTVVWQAENCPGWFVHISLGHGGLQARCRERAVAIPLEALVNLLQAHAPELFPTEENIKKAAEHRSRRDQRTERLRQRRPVPQLSQPSTDS